MSKPIVRIGPKGGKIIGYTSRGEPIYESSSGGASGKVTVPLPLPTSRTRRQGRIRLVVKPTPSKTGPQTQPKPAPQAPPEPAKPSPQPSPEPAPKPQTAPQPVPQTQPPPTPQPTPQPASQTPQPASRPATEEQSEPPSQTVEQKPPQWVRRLQEMGFEILPGETWPHRTLRFFSPKRRAGYDDPNEQTGISWQQKAISRLKERAKKVRLPDDFTEEFAGHKMLARYMIAFTQETGNEVGLIVTPTELRLVAGERSRVIYPAQLVGHAVFSTHTHPRGGPFSKQDIRCAVSLKLKKKEVLMVYPEGNAVMRLDIHGIIAAKHWYENAVETTHSEARRMQTRQRTYKEVLSFTDATLIEFLEAVCGAQVFGRDIIQRATKYAKKEEVAKILAQVKPKAPKL